MVEQKEKQSFWFTGNGMTAVILIAFVTYFLLMEHREHFFAALPYIILLLCPLLHFFMHGKHGHGGHGNNNDESSMKKHEHHKKGD